VIEFKSWVNEQKHYLAKPWLVLGKGPSFSKRSEFQTSDYFLFCLNHVVREEKVDVAHIIDIDVAEACSEAILKNCDWLIMPRIPNVRNFPSEYVTLADWLTSMPALAEMEKRGRLVTYDFSPLPGDDPWVIDARFFSSEIALGLLGRLGVRKIRSLGIDGGRTYSQSFTDLKKETLLANGQRSFNIQFERITEICTKYGIDYAPLVKPMLVYVGADETQLVASHVLEYSIHKYASRPAIVTPMAPYKFALPKEEKNRPRTGFSFQRFLIPSLCDYSDRALYVDSDMQVFTDLAELWEIPFGHQKVLCTYQKRPEVWTDFSWFHEGRQYSVMLLDCPRLPWKIEEIVRGLDEEKFSYQDLMFNLCLVQPDEIEDRVPPEWNCLEHYSEGKTKLLHYTAVQLQPWRNDDNPLRHIWEKCFQEAYLAGYLPDQLLEDALSKGDLKSSMSETIERLQTEKAIDREREERATRSKISMPVKVQLMEHQIRQLRKELQDANEKLAATEKELGIVSDRLGWAREEISEYRAHILGLEKNVHSLYSSKTWKLGRVFTKPAEIVRRSLPKKHTTRTDRPFNSHSPK
jgi:hypothetical protein